MEKQNWNWKSNFLSAALGFGAGMYYRMTKKRPDVHIHEIDIVANIPKENLVESIILLCGIWKEAQKDIGKPIQKEEIEAFNTDEAADQLLKEVLWGEEMNRSDPQMWLSQFYLTQKQKGDLSGWMSSVLNEGKKALLSSVPTVPSYVSRDVYENCERIIRVMISRRKAPDRVSELKDEIPEIKVLLEKWKRELRPEPYTKMLASYLRTIESL
jgi:hypothetical protein